MRFTGTEYEERLRKQHAALNPRTAWARKGRTQKKLPADGADAETAAEDLLQGAGKQRQSSHLHGSFMTAGRLHCNEPCTSLCCWDILQASLTSIAKKDGWVWVAHPPRSSLITRGLLVVPCTNTK